MNNFSASVSRHQYRSNWSSYTSSHLDSSLVSNIHKLFSERIEIFSSVQFNKASILTGVIKISLKVISIHWDFGSNVLLIATRQSLADGRNDETGDSFYSYLSFYSQTFLECVRLRTFSKYGLQQIQVDTHYLQLYLWRFVTDEK